MGKIWASLIKRRIGSDGDRMELAGDGFLTKVKEGYYKICQDNSSRCHIINATKNEDIIFNEIKNIISGLNKGI